MTTAHRATWFTARGHEEQGGARVFAPSKMRSKLDDPGMLTMKTRWKTKEEEEMEKAREEGDEESGKMTMRMKLLEKERSHFRKKKLEKQIMGTEDVGKDDSEGQRGKRLRIEAGTTTSAFQANPEDADDDDSENEGDNSENSDEDSDDDDDDDSDSDDDAAALMEELERIKAQRASENERKEREREQLEEMEQRDELKMGNPLLRDEMTSADDAPKGKKSATLKRRWDDDTVFRNQARDEPKREKRFVNDTIRSDFHKRFLNRYIK